MDLQWYCEMSSKINGIVSVSYLLSVNVNTVKMEEKRISMESAPR